MQNDTLPTKKPGILINRNFALLWCGQTISFMGDYFFDTTLVLWVATQVAGGQSWAPLAVGVVLAAASIPVLVIGPIAGVFADRWEKRRTMLRMDAIRTVLIALLLPFATIIHLPALPTLVIISSVVFLASASAQFFSPSSLTLISTIVEEPQHARAFGLSQTTASLAMIIAPPLATVLFFAVGAKMALLFDSLSFAVSFLTILAIRAPRSVRSEVPGKQTSFLREFVEGIRFLGGNQILITVLIAAFLVVLYEGCFSALGVFFLQQNLHTSLSFYGFLNTAMGLGLTVGALLAAAFAQRLGVTRVLSIGLTLTGLLVIVYARLTSFIPALIIMFIQGLLVAGVNVAVNPLLLQTTPQALLGRVAAVAKTGLNLSSLLAVAIVSFLASTVMHDFHASILGVAFGPIDTIFMVAGLLATLGGLYAVFNLRAVKIAKVEEEVPIAYEDTLLVE
ncbi:MAG TPA: MFS transporter [Ktedonobacteraceae bacterium]|nr:MFS transporter [Ktedonobacteraceae bacterium]